MSNFEPSSPLNGTFAGVIEITMNKVLQLDPDYQQKLLPLKDKVVGIFLTDLKLQLFFLTDENQFTVLSSFEGDTDVKLTGKSWDFFHMGINQHTESPTPLFESNIHFEGDVATGQKFAQLFSELNIDWEEALAEVMGDIVAHQAVKAAQHLGNWLKDVLGNGKENIKEYVQEEITLTPTKIEVENFFSDIAELVDDTDDLLQRFEQRANDSKKDSSE